MSPKTKKYLITTEKHEIFIVRNGHQAIHGFCPECKKEVELFSFDSAINFSRIGGRELIRRFEAGIVHSIETTGGHLLVCKSSLAKEK